MNATVEEGSQVLQKLYDTNYSFRSSRIFIRSRDVHLIQYDDRILSPVPLQIIGPCARAELYFHAGGELHAVDLVMEIVKILFFIMAHDAIAT